VPEQPGAAGLVTEQTAPLARASSVDVYLVNGVVVLNLIQYLFVPRGTTNFHVAKDLCNSTVFLGTAPCAGTVVDRFAFPHGAVTSGPPCSSIVTLAWARRLHRRIPPSTTGRAR
jgi:hypothetical protein